MRGGSFQPEECTASDCVQSPSSTSHGGRSPLHHFCKSKKAAPENSEAALTLFC